MGLLECTIELCTAIASKGELHDAARTSGMVALWMWWMMVCSARHRAVANGRAWHRALSQRVWKIVGQVGMERSWADMSEGTTLWMGAMLGLASTHTKGWLETWRNQSTKGDQSKWGEFVFGFVVLFWEKLQIAVAGVWVSSGTNKWVCNRMSRWSACVCNRGRRCD